MRLSRLGREVVYINALLIETGKKKKKKVKDNQYKKKKVMTVIRLHYKSLKRKKERAHTSLLFVPDTTLMND